MEPVGVRAVKVGAVNVRWVTATHDVGVQPRLDLQPDPTHTDVILTVCNSSTNIAS